MKDFFGEPSTGSSERGNDSLPDNESQALGSDEPKRTMIIVLNLSFTHPSLIEHNLLVVIRKLVLHLNNLVVRESLSCNFKGLVTLE